MLQGKLGRMSFVTRQGISMYLLHGIQSHINKLHDEQVALFYLVVFMLPIFCFILINIKLRLNDLALSWKWYPIAFIPIVNLYLVFAPSKNDGAMSELLTKQENELVPKKKKIDISKLKFVKLKKIHIAFLFIAALMINSVCFFWQIDRHEKALLGQEWLNPVPYQDWKYYLEKKEDYKKTLLYYNENNSQILSLVSMYNIRATQATRDKGLKFLADSFTANIHPAFDMSRIAQLEFSNSNPNEYKIWQSIIIDLDAKKPKYIPAPSNPPKPVIQQEISSLYRYLMLIDSVVLLSLISFLIIYKERTVIPCEK